jgi:hypothetical protein
MCVKVLAQQAVFLQCVSSVGSLHPDGNCHSRHVYFSLVHVERLKVGIVSAFESGCIGPCDACQDSSGVYGHFTTEMSVNSDAFCLCGMSPKMHAN